MDRIPDGLDPGVVPLRGAVAAAGAVGEDEAAGDVGAVDLEALVVGEQRLVEGPAHVVQDAGEYDGLEVRARGRQRRQLARQDQRPVRAAHAVVVHALGRVLPRVRERRRRDGRVRERHAADREVRERGWRHGLALGCVFTLGLRRAG
ncbi:putative metal dependent phosphohydrolase [Rosellinia necatrix]|uniref:Putative metal dependent phosphohydrolase n=1 Tax=Rosellinia necatrix TaxID=77044 RepID=A0A1S8A511_ROSNE|nr:putative metal dependent phosphohydrolase [Rosellinia necatrix]